MVLSKAASSGRRHLTRVSSKQPSRLYDILKMGLVDYSESEGSDTGDEPDIVSAPRQASSSKPAFQKVVDRSNPHKIRVNLPEIPRPEVDHPEGGAGERSAKRPRTGGSAFSDFNSFLPAPKRAPQTNRAGLQDGQGQKRGLGSGVSLKTGPSPGFSRETQPETLYGALKSDTELPSFDVASQHQIQETERPGESEAIVAVGDTIHSIPKKGTSMMFKPLSVVRRPQKKKAGMIPDPISSAGNPAHAAKPAKKTPTISLFSLSSDTTDTRPSISSTEEYKPIIYSTAQSKEKSPSPELLTNIDSNDDTAPNTSSTYENNPPLDSVPQSLDSIASDLNLSASAKRQLFGRQRGSSHAHASAVNIVNFNTDEEYAANEALRAAGEQVLHNPVKALAPGKHSLKQLVNAASSQKDALEEHFASGRRNKKEAGSRYGW